MKFLKSDWIAPFFQKYRFGQFMAIFLGLLTMVFAGLLMFSSGYVISRSAALPENILIIYVPTLMVRIFGIGRPVLRYIERLTSHNWIFRVTSLLRKKLYLRLESQAIELANRHRLGELLGLLNEDIGNLQDLYLRTLFPVFIGGALLVSLLVLAGVFSIWLVLGLALFLGVLYFVFPYLSVKLTAGKDEKLKLYRNRLYSKLTDNIMGLSDWVLSGRERDFLEIYKAEEASVHEEQTSLFRFARNRSLVMQVVYGLLVAFLMFWAAGNLKTGDNPNYIAAVVLGIFPLFDAFSPLSDAWVESNRYRDSVRRLEGLPEPVEEVRDQTITGSDLTISQLSFAYLDGQEALTADSVKSSDLIYDRLNLQVKAGEHLAILGRSGAGKSTLAGLIRGDLKPLSGEIRIAGVDPRKAQNIEQKVGVIQQNPYIFNTTLRNNLTIANLEVTDEAIYQALDAVGLKELAAQLPEGLDTMVDEAGEQFSGGERHRLALSRILLANVDIVILDEATLGLDTITENKLLKTTFDLLKDKTVIFITHHLLGIHQLDRVIFIEDQGIKIDGSPIALLQDNPEFARLYALDKGF